MDPVKKNCVLSPESNEETLYLLKVAEHSFRAVSSVV